MMCEKWMVLVLGLLMIVCDGAERRNVGFEEKLHSSNSNSNSNSTLDCSPSAPCLPCQYSEKNDDKYRCSETGYRIPFKCTADVKNKPIGKAVNGDNAEAKATDDDGASSKEYVTYRSCTPDVNQENLSVLGFEVLVLGLLLVSGSLVFLRRKKTVAVAGTGGVRLQSHPRF
ncbi:hypothetical protein KSS87_017249 [Heliosperma pusillum]|nr:hypothetical protein KSS87_002883 [Heliosperma pusillum]KAH9615535.1 hypothetical protein KSS87_017249 [Heliosperma pusillum]